MEGAGVMLGRYSIVPTIPVTELERAKRFFAEKLGLIPYSEDDGAAHYRSGSGTFDLYPTQFAGTAQHTLLAWEVDDIDLVVAGLRDRGVVFEDYDFPGMDHETGIATIEADRVAWFKDTEGNILAVAQPRSDVRRVSYELEEVAP
jgi:catechol 2,3-dioxygenase-like lactoylglutathione lyase family enzyme